MTEICAFCACGQKAMHTVGNKWMCCKCYVLAGNPPADWHKDCMEAYKKYGDSRQGAAAISQSRKARMMPARAATLPESPSAFNVPPQPWSPAMKTTILASLAFCLMAFASGLFAGRTLTAIERQPFEIKNGCAYYDMDSGKFTWGQRPVTIGMPYIESGDLQVGPAPKGKSK